MEIISRSRKSGGGPPQSMTLARGTEHAPTWSTPVLWRFVWRTAFGSTTGTAGNTVTDMETEMDSEKDFFDFKCPYCRKVVSFPKEWMGTVQQCLWCSADIVVPESSKQAPREIRLDIHTNRLFFRRLKDTDRNDLLEFLSDSDSLIYSDFRTMDEEQVEKWLVEDVGIKSCMELGNDAYFGIELPIASKLIALVSFKYRSEEFRSARFDLVVNRQFADKAMERK